jgi:hypothetical protein
MATPVQSPMYQQTTTTSSGFQGVPTQPGGPIFKSYGDYLVATQTDVRPGSSYNATVTTPTGFLEFKPRDMEIQKKYDAMSPSWEGVDSSMKAVEQGVYALDSAEATRQKDREVLKVPDGAGPTTLQIIGTTLESLRPTSEPQALYPPLGICGVQ